MSELENYIFYLKLFFRYFYLFNLFPTNKILSLKERISEGGCLRQCDAVFIYLELRFLSSFAKKNKAEIT